LDTPSYCKKREQNKVPINTVRMCSFITDREVAHIKLSQCSICFGTTSHSACYIGCPALHCGSPRRCAHVNEMLRQSQIKHKMQVV